MVSPRYAMMIMKWLILLLALLIMSAFADHGENSDTLRLSRIALCTVVDPMNPTVVRDSLTLFRSISLFGKTMNDVTKIVGLPLGRETMEGSSISIPMEVVREFLRYKVQILLFPPATPKYAGTMNKFHLLRSLKDQLDNFDYILWMDADMIVVNDPISSLPMHKFPGEISCVPEFYSYMRRYPIINSSENYWNPSLPAFTLIGENEVAPHGMCNTGMLYFDRYSLRNLMTVYDNALNDIPPSYHRDRFFDSLIFVYGVNKQAIPVAILPYTFNYMALFEGEILQLTQTNSPLLAHFLSDTEFFCNLALDNLKCDCYYHNEHILPDSMLVPSLQKFLLPEACYFMATGKVITDEKIDGESICDILWPPKNWDCPRLQRIQVLLSCRVDVLVVIVVRDGETGQMNVHESYVSGSLTPHSIILDAGMINMDRNNSDKVLRLNVEISSSDNHFTQLFNASIRIPNQFRAMSGRMVYGLQPLLGSKPISLESQLVFHEFIQFYNTLDDSSGLVVCCESVKGMISVGNLLGAFENAQRSLQYSGARVIHVLVRRVPLEHYTESVDIFIDRFLRSKCPHYCIFWSAHLSSDLQGVLNAFPSAHFNFAFIDAYAETYDANIELLNLVFTTLKKGGWMLGTNYILHWTHMGEVLPLHGQLFSHAASMRMNYASYGILAFAAKIQHNLMFTYLEREEVYCNNDLGLIEIQACFPSWYLQKSIIS